MESFGWVGWDILVLEVSMFCWVLILVWFWVLGSLEYFKLFLENVDVVVVLGIGFGEYGDGYVCIGLVENE